ncbi:DUF6278 family protein [Streptomyces sp. XM4193]|uniref:DUF6278 family protein n=1 Tax=Streptomyces sp. XM4193 TaxID=2929782 RepID=UPI001FF9629C|nr:DUF6278 family protein [Streptomyces sp. XM4193]MCK1797205.1 DUF6278 family protein [Streptomyces sp. XM4193]
MNIPFLDNWRKKHGTSRGAGVMSRGEVSEQGLGELLAECEVLRAQAAEHGVELDDSVGSLESLDQLLPRWRDDPEVLLRLGSDAGLYLGTVLVRGVAGAHWEVLEDGRPVVRLASGRVLDVVEAGHAWAVDGTPELSQSYAEAAEV